MTKFDFARGLSSIHDLGHEGARERGGDQRASSVTNHRPPNASVVNSHPDVGLLRVSYSC